jgi:hypothetical protein
MTAAPGIVQLAQRFGAPAVQAIALMGSYAGGVAGPHIQIGRLAHNELLNYIGYL